MIKWIVTASALLVSFCASAQMLRSELFFKKIKKEHRVSYPIGAAGEEGCWYLSKSDREHSVKYDHCDYDGGSRLNCTAQLNSTNWTFYSVDSAQYFIYYEAGESNERLYRVQKRQGNQTVADRSFLTIPNPAWHTTNFNTETGRYTAIVPEEGAKDVLKIYFANVLGPADISSVTVATPKGYKVYSSFSDDASGVVTLLGRKNGKLWVCQVNADGKLAEQQHELEKDGKDLVLWNVFVDDQRVYLTGTISTSRGWYFSRAWFVTIDLKASSLHAEKLDFKGDAIHKTGFKAIAPEECANADMAAVGLTKGMDIAFGNMLGSKYRVRNVAKLKETVVVAMENVFIHSERHTNYESFVGELRPKGYNYFGGNLLFFGFSVDGTLKWVRATRRICGRPYPQKSGNELITYYNDGIRMALLGLEHTDKEGSTKLVYRTLDSEGNFTLPIVFDDEGEAPAYQMQRCRFLSIDNWILAEYSDAKDNPDMDLVRINSYVVALD